MATVSSLDRIGVGIDTARYGHRVCFLRPDRQPAARPLTVLESRDGYQALQERLEHLRRQHPQVHFHVRIDAAGQYAANLERFLRGLPLPLTISIGEPKRNKDYQKAHFPKRTCDDTESQAMARFAIVEQPLATPASTAALDLLREATGRLQAQVKQTTQAINRLHNLLARVFPELATLADDVATQWVLRLLDKYPSADCIGRARLASLEQIPFLSATKAKEVHLAAQRSVGSLRGTVAEALVRDLVRQVRHCQDAEQTMRDLVVAAFADLPPSGHRQLVTIPGIGNATAAVLVGKIASIDRFETPAQLVGYFGIFPRENTSGVDQRGNPVPPGTMRMAQQGNDLVRCYLWNAARSAIRFNPAIRALYRRLRCRCKRGDVAMGQCMRKLLHLVFAVWKTDRPFDEHHFPWEPVAEPATSCAAAPAALAPSTPPDITPRAAASPETSVNDKAVGHKREIPAKKVVATAASNVAPPRPAVNPPPAPCPPAPLPATSTTRPKVDYAFLRAQISIEKVLRHLGFLDALRGRGLQRRGPCPVHGRPADRAHTFSVHLGKNICQCFQAECGVQGNVLDLWAAVHRLPLYEAALHLAATFQVPPNREEEPVP
jgi:transposase